MILYDYITLFKIIITFPLCYLLTIAIKALAKKVNFINYPNPIVESHKSKTPYGGGIAISFTLIIFLLLSPTQFQQSFNIIVLVLLVSLIGLLDDLFRFSPLNKFILQLVSVIPILIYFEVTSTLLLLLFALILLSSQNAWNLIDVMDGLTAGVSFMVFITIGILLLRFEELFFFSTLAFALAFSVLGFRMMNKNPAKIFLGESGSLLIGSFFGFFMVKSYSVSPTLAILILMAAIVPFFELLFLIIVRIKKGIPFYRGSPDHFSLRMLNNRFSIKSINSLTMIYCAINSLLIILTNLFLGDSLSLIICILFSLISIITAYFYFLSLPAKITSK